MRTRHNGLWLTLVASMAMSGGTLLVGCQDPGMDMDMDQAMEVDHQVIQPNNPSTPYEAKPMDNSQPTLEQRRLDVY